MHKRQRLELSAAEIRKSKVHAEVIAVVRRETEVETSVTTEARLLGLDMMRMHGMHEDVKQPEEDRTELAKQMTDFWVEEYTRIHDSKRKLGKEGRQLLKEKRKCIKSLSAF